VAKYSFCEGVHAGPNTRWHIRKLSREGPKLTGGIDTTTLCGRVAPFGVEKKDSSSGWGGWDLQVEITKHHLDHCCPECATAYRKATGEAK
jgi:hypothetical protein